MINTKCMLCDCEIAPNEGESTPYKGRYIHRFPSQCWSNLVETREALEKENQALRHGYARMWFAYVNGDKEMPHEFEKDIEKEAEQLLGSWKTVMLKEINSKHVMLCEECGGVLKDDYYTIVRDDGTISYSHTLLSEECNNGRK